MLSNLKRIALAIGLILLALAAYITLRPSDNVIPGAPGGHGPGGAIGGGPIGGSEIPAEPTQPGSESSGAATSEPVEAAISIENGAPVNGEVRTLVAHPGQAVSIDVTTADAGPNGEEVVYEVRLYATPDFADITELVSTSQGYRFAFQVPGSPQRSQYELSVDKEFDGDPGNDGPLAVVRVE